MGCSSYPEVSSESKLVFASEEREPTNLEEFLSALEDLPPQPTLQQLENVVRNANITLADVSSHLTFDAQKYCRTRIARFPNAEVLVLGWLSGQKTPIHDHAGSACVVKVLEGRASEFTYRRADCGMLYPEATAHYSEGTVMSSFDEDVHQVANMEGAGKSLVTLHCYAPPLDEMRVFPQEDTIFTGYPELYRQVMERIAKAT